MCVPISKGTVDLYSCLNKPAMWAGQPGHANLITFQVNNKSWTAEIEQDFAGGPTVTCAQWYFDEDPGTQLHYRDLYYWPGAEYHLGLALAMNVGIKSYMDTRLAREYLQDRSHRREAECRRQTSPLRLAGKPVQPGDLVPTRREQPRPDAGP